MLLNGGSDELTERRVLAAVNELVSEVLAHVPCAVVCVQKKRELGTAVSHAPALHTDTLINYTRWSNNYQTRPFVKKVPNISRGKHCS